MSPAQMMDVIRAVPPPTPHHPSPTERVLLNALWGLIDAMDNANDVGTLRRAYDQARAAVEGFGGVQ